MTASAELSTWDSWIAVLEAAVADYDRQLTGQPGVAVAPVFREVPAPDGALPPALVSRTQAALCGLERLTIRTEERRDGLAAQLAVLARPRRRPVGYDSEDLGRSFDCSG